MLSGPVKSNERARVSKDEDGTRSRVYPRSAELSAQVGCSRLGCARALMQTHRSATGLRKLACSPRAAMLLSMRATVRGAFWPNEATWKNQPAAVGNDRWFVLLFPACYLQGAAQLQRVGRQPRASPRIVRRCCVARGSMSWRGAGAANPSYVNFAMAGVSPRGDNAWAALGHATCHATRDEPCGSEVEG